MGLRRKSREMSLQFLYGHDFQERSCAPEEVQQALDDFTQVFEVDNRALPYGRELIEGLCAQRGEIDVLLAKHSHNWRVERMSLVDRNILRIAIYEMVHGKDVPAQVAINEALEIAKRYSVADSISFINGILDSVQNSLAPSS